MDDKLNRKIILKNNNISKYPNKNNNLKKFIFFLRIIYLILSISITLSSEIHMIVKGNGEQQILNNSFYL